MRALFGLLVALAPLLARTERAGGEDPRAALEGGVAWLCAHQLPDGGFGSHHSARPIEVLASFPGSQDAFRCATSALALVALMEARAVGAGEASAVDRALERGFDYLLASYDVKRQSGIEHYNVWSFGFALHAIGQRLLERSDDPRASRLRAAAAHLVEKLARYQSLDGGWGYLSLWGHQTYRPAATSMSFTTATILVGLERARAAGVEVGEPLLARAVRALESSRLPDGPFSYGPLWNRAPAAGINRPAGAACRTSACQLALRRLGHPVPAGEERRALEELAVRQARFQRLGLRRPIPHESWYAISGYFYLYGHAYAAWALEALPEADRARFAPLLAEAVCVCREPDGSFWDYPLYSYHKAYGTAFAVIALARTLAVPARAAATDPGPGG